MTNKKLPIQEQHAIEDRLNQSMARLKIVEQEVYVAHWKNITLDDLEGEVWKDIKGWEGIYQISNLVRVKSFCPIGRKKAPSVRIMRQTNHPEGYKMIRLRRPKAMGLIHRLMAQTFIPNPDNHPQVNHVNGIRDDNRIINLEWSTRSHDIYHRNRILKTWGYDHYKGIDSPFSKKVVQKDFNGNVIRVWNSQGDIQRATGFHQGDISRCCTGKHKTSHGYKWEFYDEQV